MSDRATLKAFFETGDFPDQVQFSDWLDSVPLPTKVTKIFSDFQPEVTDTKVITMFAGVAGTVPVVVKVKHTIAFTGGAVNGAFCNIQDANSADLVSNPNLNGAPGASIGSYASNWNLNAIPDQAAPSNYLVQLFVTGGVINDLVAGSVDLWVVELPLV